MDWTSYKNTAVWADKLRTAKPEDWPNILRETPVKGVQWVNLAKMVARKNPSVLVDVTKQTGVRIPSDDIEGILSTLAFSIAENPNNAEFFAAFVETARFLFNKENRRFAVCMAADMAPTLLPRVLIALCERDEVSWLIAAKEMATRGQEALQTLIATYEEASRPK